jgi:hypothetical protein
MLTAIERRVPVEEITLKARNLHLGRSLLTLVAGVFYGLGWLAGKVVGGVFLAVAWSLTAIKVGWIEARDGSARPHR